MRKYLPLAPVLMFWFCVPALAQVTVNLRALDALPHLPPVAARPRPLSRTPPPPRHVVATERAREPPAPGTRALSRSAGPTQTGEGTQTVQRTTAGPQAPHNGAAAKPPAALASGPAPPAATLPPSPPPVAMLAPLGSPPTGRTPPSAAPPKPPIAANATTRAAPGKTGLQLVFPKGKSDLNPESAAAIKRLAKAAPDNDATTFNVLAYASGDPNDPSVARRMSLSRAIAVRQALMADGVPSAQIYLRALGSQPGNGGPPNRVDINVMGINATSSAAQQ
jgi:outer membrane protein OmpA-like peptidoglycan-associated protein